MKEHSIDIQLSHPDDLFHLFGSNERHLRLMEDELDVIIHARTEIVQVLGEESSCEEARQVIQALMVLVNRGMTVGTPDVVTAINMVRNSEIDKFVALYEEEIIKDNTGKPIRVKTLGQKLYVDSVKNHDVTFGIGPAGTGKTFLAVTLAVTALKRGQVKRIILTRPAVEAGESLGFLPGDLKEKVDPYLRPVYEKHGVLHYAVANIPGAVARTSTIALTNVTLPYIEALAGKGFKKAILEDAGLLEGVTTYQGQLTSQPVAEGLERDFTPISELV